MTPKVHAIGEFAYAKKHVIESHGKCKEICVDSDSNVDDPEKEEKEEKEEKTPKFRTIRVAIQMVDKLKQFAHNSLEHEELVISLNSVCRLQEKNPASPAE